MHSRTQSPELDEHSIVSSEGARDQTHVVVGLNRDIKGGLWLVEVRRMSTEPLDDCKRCGRQVREDHSYVMVVPVGHKRLYFHGGCEPIE